MLSEFFSTKNILGDLASGGLGSLAIGRPVTKEAASEHHHPTAAAISSGLRRHSLNLSESMTICQLAPLVSRIFPRPSSACLRGYGLVAVLGDEVALSG
jgi:hypothetical protein